MQPSPKGHVFIGTPMYGGLCTLDYVISLLGLRDALGRAGYRTTLAFTGNHSLITTARNDIAHMFLASEATHLLFIDADHGFDASGILRMLESGKEMIGGFAPIKSINWNLVKKAALAGEENLESVSGFFATNLIDGQKIESFDQPIEVQKIGTGLLLIKREVFEKLRDSSPSYTSKGSPIVPDGDKVYDFFQTGVKNGQYRSEDFYFCEKYKDTGGKIWAVTWCNMTHVGNYSFKGSIVEGYKYAKN